MDGEHADERRAWFRSAVLPLEANLLVYARRIGRQAGLEAEDLVHETFLRLMVAENWREIDSVSAFATRTLHNLAVSAIRRGKIVSINAVGDLAALDAFSAGDEAPGPEALLESRQELRQLQAIVGELPQQCRRVFTLRKIYDLPIAEVADRLGITVSTAEKHMTKALRICSEKLARRPSATRKAAERTWRAKRHLN